MLAPVHTVDEAHHFIIHSTEFDWRALFWHHRFTLFDFIIVSLFKLFFSFSLADKAHTLYMCTIAHSGSQLGQF